LNRRQFLASTVLTLRSAKASRSTAGTPDREASAGGAASAERSQSLATEGWRLFEITTHVHVQNASGVTRAWLPTPLVGMPYQQTLGDTYQAEGGRVVMVESEELDLLYAEWAAGADPILNLTSRVATRDHAVDLTTPRVAPPLDFSAFARYLRPMKTVSVEAPPASGAGTDLDRVRALFDADADAPRPGAPVVDRHTRFVAVVRAAGVPARPVYGLGLGAPDATHAHQTRAEVYLAGFGWVPVDLDRRTFGSWRSPWVAFNAAHDVMLPKSPGKTVPAFMYPQAETANGRVDSLAAETFRYEIGVRDGA
jgi:hypothetical protein